MGQDPVSQNCAGAVCGDGRLCVATVEVSSTASPRRAGAKRCTLMLRWLSTCAQDCISDLAARGRRDCETLMREQVRGPRGRCAAERILIIY
eukprot:6179487-Pleurochrysis_carterae.AAC.2